MPGPVSPPPSLVKKKRRIAPRLISSLIISPYFTMKTIPKKGQGLIANFKIEALSTVLLEEPPILSIPCTMDENDGIALMIWLEDHLRIFPKDIADEKRTATLQLANSHPHKLGLAGILMTNGFQLPAEEDWPSCRGLFLQISRINHACQPNCARRWVGGEKKVMMMIPVKDIQAGEEITITYLPDGACQGVMERRKWLMSEFGFWCRCELCIREGDEWEVGVKAGGARVDSDASIPSENEAEASEEKVKAKSVKPDANKTRPAWTLNW